MLTLLRLGIAKFTNEGAKEFINLSCNLMLRYYLQTIVPQRPPLCIQSFCSEAGKIDLLKLTKVLFQELPLPPILNQVSWVMMRFKPKLKGPSEKVYKNHFYSILYQMTQATNWQPSLEMNRGNKMKVDLGLVYSLEGFKTRKYLIELAVNCRMTGDDYTAESHYIRSRDRYSSSDINGSIVVIIYTTKPKKILVAK